MQPGDITIVSYPKCCGFEGVGMNPLIARCEQRLRSQDRVRQAIGLEAAIQAAEVPVAMRRECSL
jgi:hypothetical protein